MSDIITPDEAQYLAFRIIDFITHNEDRFDHFLTTTGLQPSAVQSKVVSPDLLLSVLDYTVKDEALLLTLQKEQHIRPASVMVGCLYLSESGFADQAFGAGSASPEWHWLL